MVIMNLDVDLAMSSLEGISTGTRQVEGVGDVFVILDVEMRSVSKELELDVVLAMRSL